MKNFLVVDESRYGVCVAVDSLAQAQSGPIFAGAEGTFAPTAQRAVVSTKRWMAIVPTTLRVDRGSPGAT